MLLLDYALEFTGGRAMSTQEIKCLKSFCPQLSIAVKKRMVLVWADGILVAAIREVEEGIISRYTMRHDKRAVIEKADSDYGIANLPGMGQEIESSNPWWDRRHGSCSSSGDFHFRALESKVM